MRAVNWTTSRIQKLSEKSLNRIKEAFSWEKIVDDYEKIF